MLSLTTNAGRGHALIVQSLRVLSAPYLQEMQLSALGLTHAPAPYIVDNISSRIAASALCANGSRLGLHSARYTGTISHFPSFECTPTDLGRQTHVRRAKRPLATTRGALRVDRAIWQDSEGAGASTPVKQAIERGNRA
ncbi:uncharacterized protein B0H18DRAFT_651157 [Fomitopsis serialis]|uniref:uncharacterized protein n=1 Tax=Fomitopsis serialis TaxID=139415 RepID=UPI0020079A41|nr:uncharacterized protein B0H18DRAFT_651157 [Neoantrodia serialis]KAH9919240.1 hypothetical protein B0H18DRAFT_651157 [Neoantrodia serialis]